MDFPKYKYHPTELPILVHSKAQEDALSEDWANSPAEHGVITHPSAEQLAEMEAAALEEAAEDAGLVEPIAAQTEAQPAAPAASKASAAPKKAAVKGKGAKK